uniref:Enhancer of mRNA-decapping protein 4 n=1 Tax=Aceria tosichella TaxID=561515 RepID=A0A6G1SA73_9ACAR
MDKIALSRVPDDSNRHHSSAIASITEVAKVEKIVDYSFERNEKSNVLAIHPTRPLIAYLIQIQRTQKISKAWSSGNDSIQSPSSSLINGQNSSLLNSSSSSSDRTKTVSIRIIDYETRQRCLAKGVYHARPTDCVFTINSLICTQSEVIKMAVVDRLANVYLYDLSYFINDLTATRIAVIRSPAHEVTPYDRISLVWCPFVPCEDFEDGDGGLRLALATDTKIEIFAIDRLQGKTGELHRSDLREAYKCIRDAHKSTIVSLTISPDCSTVSAAALDNRVTFFSSDIDEVQQRCLHSWEATMTDSPISKLFFLDDYPKLLEDSNMKFWGAAFIGTKEGQMLLIDLRTWTVYQKMQLSIEGSNKNNFDYRLDLTARNMVAINGNQCYVIQIEHDYAHLSTLSSNTSDVSKSHQSEHSLLDSSQNDMMNGNIFDYLLSKSATTTPRSNQKQPVSKKHSTTSNIGTITNIPPGLPKIVKATRLSLHTPIYSFVLKHKSNDDIELFTISAYSLERYIINLSSLEAKTKPPPPPEPQPQPQLQSHLQQQQQQLQDIQKVIASTTTKQTNVSVPSKAVNTSSAGTISVEVSQMDKMVEALFTKLNVSFSQGLDEFMSEIKCEVNDLKSKLTALSRDVNKLQQQLHDIRHR